MKTTRKTGKTHTAKFTRGTGATKSWVTFRITEWNPVALVANSKGETFETGDYITQIDALRNDGWKQVA